MIGLYSRSEYKAYFALLEHVAGALTLACLRACIGHQFVAPGRLIVVGRLLGIAYIKLDMVSAIEREEICRLSSGWFIGGECVHCCVSLIDQM